ncbi:MAG: hypothetical protein KGO94_12290 [Alphaproteobacteria bacterium]|nr:hypothetical protein [Alphaproteobacteria bacterium]
MRLTESLLRFSGFLLLAILALWPAYLYGPPLGHSLANNLVWLSSFDAGIWRGEIYPRWMPELWFGAGAPDFFFYGPLPFWVSSTFGRGLCWDCETPNLLNAGTVVLFALSGLGYFHLARRFFEAPQALLAAGLYVILPYHLMIDWGVRQALGELAAYAFVPVMASALVGLMRRETASVFILAASVGGLVLSHLPSVVMVAAGFGPVALGVSIFGFPKWPERLRFFALSAGGAVLGLGLSVFYWWPALSLLSTVSSETLWQTAFNWSHWLFFDGVDEPNPPLMLLLKFWLVVVTAITALVLWRIKADRVLLLLCVAPLVAAWFFMTVLSWPVWWLVRPLQAIQFPWRFMMLAEFGLPLVVALGFAKLRLGPVAVVLAVLAAGSGWTGFQLAQVLGLQRDLVEATVKDHLSAWEYLPRTAFAPILKLTSGRRDAVRADWAATPDHVSAVPLQQISSRRLLIHVNDATPRPIIIRQFYWPLWQAVDVTTSTSLALSPEPKFGLITIDVPSGAHDIVLNLRHDRSETWGLVLALISASTLLGWWAWLRFRRS